MSAREHRPTRNGPCPDCASAVEVVLYQISNKFLCEKCFTVVYDGLTQHPTRRMAR
ncbi:hypothetical protein UFOVP1328_3 [uncultured Caudovirales phage]|uniref:Uncharacterized protein n=1 Tax=uncultured Caudovirales phage TaxID=2100421 RepID=A0A6J7XBU7_9CAUD|nr:hypothetical protein UFOVP1084_13 [uncultured Caudovirales phage]CAB4198916.1 hypothetical protein UFOVP1328_3 [uncultured Caudovirales phage]CAB5228381.1 hypothetical protein UFOVP1532_34 [uncultured Caudovirales phage]